jgi:hypothetical protein
MTEFRLSEASLAALKARLATPEGKEALRKLANLIAQSAVEAMPPDLQESLKTKEGLAAFQEAWPDIVEAFLFRGVDRSKPRARPQRMESRKSTGRAARKK